MSVNPTKYAFPSGWFVAWAAITVLCILCAPWHANAQVPLDSGKIYSRWDSLPEIQVPETAPVLIEDEHITVREIVERAAQGERTKLKGYRSMTFTSTVRAISFYKKKKEIEEYVVRVYSDKDGFTRRVNLDESKVKYKREGDEWVLDEGEDKDPVKVQVETRRYNEFSDIPFFLEDTSEFDFKLIDRTLDGDHVVFEVAFRPKTDFKPLPYGVVFITTKGYRIIHEEYHFDKNPFPLFLKDVKRMSRQWAQLPSGHWVFTKIQLELDLMKYPFDWVPQTIALVAVRDDYRFDEPYDERLFGKMKGPKEVGTAGERPAISADSLIVASGLLGELQTNDDAFYREDLGDIDKDFTTSVIASHDSLGLDGLLAERRGRLGDIDFSAGPSTELTAYNRVEGLVIAARGGAKTGGRISLDLDAHAAYSTGPGRFRYLGEVAVPMEVGMRTTLGLEADFGDHVVPYGTNTIPLSSVRALVGGADDQDYLQSLGGFGGIALRGESFTVRAGYGAAEETSVRATTDFSFINSMSSINQPIEDGHDRGVVADLDWNFRERLTVRFAQRVSGGSLGGDFRYNRSDLFVRFRQFIVGPHELEFTGRGITTSDLPPVQRLADIGGIMTVRGYDRRTLVGEHGVALRLEYLFPYDIFQNMRIPLLKSAQLQFIPWGDAGRVGDGTTTEWIHSVGFGVQRFLGPFGEASNLRLDFAWPTSRLKVDNFRAFLYFTAQTF